MDDYSFCLYPAEPEETHLLPQQENCTTIQIIHHLTWGGVKAFGTCFKWIFINYSSKANL